MRFLILFLGVGLFLAGPVPPLTAQGPALGVRPVDEQSPPAVPTVSGVVRGVVEGDWVYVCGTLNSKLRTTMAGRGTLVVGIGSVEPGKRTSVHNPLIVVSWSHPESPDPLKWHVTGGRLWVTEFWWEATSGCIRRVRTDDLTLMPPRFGEYDREEGLEQSNLAMRRIARDNCVPLALINDLTHDHARCPDSKDFGFDFLPGPGDDCSFFLRTKGTIERWEYRSKPRRGGGDDGKWSLKDVWAADWPGAFHVVESGGTYFFVEGSGKIYSAKPGAKPADRVTKLVWAGKGPFTSLIFDAAGGKAFAFTRTCFFEVKEKVEPVRCFDLSPHTDELDSALHCVIRCGRLLRQHKLIP